MRNHRKVLHMVYGVKVSRHRLKFLGVPPKIFTPQKDPVEFRNFATFPQIIPK